MKLNNTGHMIFSNNVSAIVQNVKRLIYTIVGKRFSEIIKSGFPETSPWPPPSLWPEPEMEILRKFLETSSWPLLSLYLWWPSKTPPPLTPPLRRRVIMFPFKKITGYSFPNIIFLNFAEFRRFNGFFAASLQYDQNR